MKRISPLALLLLFAATTVSAMDNFAYTDARTLSMGKASTALAEGEGAIFYNPAGLAYTENRTAGLSGIYQDYSWEYTSYEFTFAPDYSERGFSAYYLQKGFAVSFSLMGEGWWDELEFSRDIWDPAATYTITPVFYERYATVSYAHEVMNGLSLGATAKYLNTDDPYDMFETKNGFTLDAGILYRAAEALTIGLSVANIVFSDIDFALPNDFGQHAYLIELPRDLSIGAAYRPHRDVVITADVHDLFEDGIEDMLYGAYYTSKRSYHIGCEWRALEGIFIRAGYFYDERISKLPNRFERYYEYEPYHNVTFGAGLSRGKLGFDAGLHLDNRKSKMEEHPIELTRTTLMGTAALSFSF